MDEKYLKALNIAVRTFIDVGDGSDAEGVHAWLMGYADQGEYLWLALLTFNCSAISPVKGQNVAYTLERIQTLTDRIMEAFNANN